MRQEKIEEIAAAIVASRAAHDAAIDVCCDPESSVYARIASRNAHMKSTRALRLAMIGASEPEMLAADLLADENDKKAAQNETHPHHPCPACGH